MSCHWWQSWYYHIAICLLYDGDRMHSQPHAINQVAQSKKNNKNCFITISATSRITFSLMSGIKLHCRHPRVMHESAKRVLWMTYHSYSFILSEAKLFFVCAAGTQLDPPHSVYEGPVVCCCPQRFVEWTLKRVWIGVWNRLCQQSASEEETQIQYLFIYKRSRLLKDSE